LPTLVLVLIAVVLASFGQIAMKYGMNMVGPLGSGAAIVLGLIKAIFTPWVFAGFFLYLVSSFIWLMVLKQAKLSYAYPLIASGYIVVMFLSWLFLGDRNIPPIRYLGVVLICLGVVFVARS